MIELTSSDALLNFFPFVWCDSSRDSRQNFGGSCQFEKNMTFKLYQYVCWCIRERKKGCTDGKTTLKTRKKVIHLEDTCMES